VLARSTNFIKLTFVVVSHKIFSARLFRAARALRGWLRRQLSHCFLASNATAAATAADATMLHGSTVKRCVSPKHRMDRKHSNNWKLLDKLAAAMAERLRGRAISVLESGAVYEPLTNRLLDSGSLERLD